MSFNVRNWRGAFALSILSGLFLPGCGDSPNKVVGDSNGWTVEQYRQAVAEQDKQSEKPTPAVASKNQ